MKFPIFFFIFPFFFIFTFTNSGTTAVHNRRTLHQPFFPLDSPPTVPPPSSSTDVPFTPNPTTAASPPADRPFFQDLPSPPPPQSSNPSASFPANISSLDLPNSAKSKTVSSKLIATAVTLVIAAAVVLAIVGYLRVKKRRRYGNDSTSVSDEKTHRSESSSRRVVATSNGNNSGGGGSVTSNNSIHFNPIPKLNRPSQSSAEFLYLGTIVNSTNAIVNNRRDEKLDIRKLDSPELRPLPPLVSVGGGKFENVKKKKKI